MKRELGAVACLAPLCAVLDDLLLFISLGWWRSLLPDRLKLSPIKWPHVYPAGVGPCFVGPSSLRNKCGVHFILELELIHCHPIFIGQQRTQLDTFPLPVLHYAPPLRQRALLFLPVPNRNNTCGCSKFQGTTFTTFEFLHALLFFNISLIIQD